MSLNFVTKKLQIQSLREEERGVTKGEREDDSGTESDDERGDDAEEEVSYQGGRFELQRTTFTREEIQADAVETRLTNNDDQCDTDDNYSSEEELKEINNEKPQQSFSVSTSSAAEKRKWSEIDGSDSESESQSPGFVIRLGSSEGDKMLRDVDTPVQFRTSPPLDVHKPRQSPPPKLFHMSEDRNTDSEFQVNGGRRHHHHHSNDLRSFSSPNKRHRSTPRPQNIQRPCLDFEKMQQIKKRVVTSWRPKGTELSLFCW